MKKYIGLLCVVFMLSILNEGCATILGGTRDVTRVQNGTPENAKVYLNGNYIGDAPKNVKVPKKINQGNHTIEIKEEGYKNQKVEMTRKISIGYVILDICTGGIWLVPDFITGAIYKPRPNKVKYYLEKK